MKFYSTRDPKKKLVSLETAVLSSLAEDGGLYMPKTFPKMSEHFFRHIGEMSFQEIAYEVAHTFLDGAVREADLMKIVYESINFDAPLVNVGDIYVLELFHGPTMAFKDFGARFMARLTSHFLEKSGDKATVLVATSGDTGGAVGNGFLGSKNIEVVLLYPSKKVSHLQEMQLTTMGKNIIALEVDGVFDDCQNFVKQAFTDEDLKNKYNFTSANSINIARLLPQMFYYFYAYGQLVKKLGANVKPPVFSVPSGNFGNLTAGLFAQKMGLPVTKFVAANNKNDAVSIYHKTGKYKPKPSVSTFSNAMDVGAPSNFERIEHLFDGDIKKFRDKIWVDSFGDKDTKELMKSINQAAGYLLDPHCAVGVLALGKYYLNAQHESVSNVVLGTAHPAKFAEEIKKEIGIEVKIPKEMKKFLEGKKSTIKMTNKYQAFKDFLLKRL